MASGQVGRLSVRVLPDTSQFNKDLKKVLDRAEKSVRATIQVDLEVTRASLANLKRQLEGIKAVVPVAAGLDDESRRRIKDEIEDIAATVTANVDVDSAVASATLARVSRARIVPLHVQVSASSLSTAMSTLAALSGARVLGDLGSSLRDMASNMDRSLPRVAAMATAITSLSAAALAGTSNLFAIGASLASIAPAALALPGLFAGFATGIGVMVTVMKDMGDVLADLGPQFTALQDRMSTDFWSVAEAPIRRMVDQLFPAFSAGVQAISTDLGGFMASLSNALSSSLGGDTLSRLFEPLGESIRIASTALAPLVQGITNLGMVGGDYLPRLAAWFVEISESFKTWTETADISGMIDAGVVALQDLGRVLSGTGGILAGFASAAEAAGGASLGMLADGLHRVSDAINGPIWQGALTTVFEGAHAAMSALGPGVSALGDAFISLAPTLATIMELAGQIGSVALTAISSAFQNPAFQGGLVTFFEGVLAGVQAIAPALPAVGAAFGSIASLAGTLAATIGPVLGAALQGLAPVVTMVADAFAQIAPLLGGVLLAAVTALAPMVQQLVAAFLPLVTTLVSALAPILMTLISALLPPFQLIIQAISAVLPTVGAMLALMAGALAQVATAIAPLVAQMVGQLAPILMQLISAILPPLMTVIQAIVGIIPQLIPLFVMVATAAMQILTAVAPLVIQLVSGLLPVFAQLASTVIPMVVQALATILPPILDLVKTIIGTLLPVIEALLPVVVTIFEGISKVIQGAMKVIQGVIDVVMGIISGNWEQVWDGIKGILEGIWDIMQGVVQTVINVILGIIKAVLDIIVQVWNAIWSDISSFLSDTWSNITSAVDSAINGVRSVIDSVLNAISSIWNSIWSNISSFLSETWSNISAAVNSAIMRVQSIISSIMGAISGIWNSMWSSISSFLSDTWSNISSAVSDGIGNILDWFSTLPGDIMGFLSGLPGQLLSMGGDMMQGFINGIKNVGAGIKNVIGDLIGGAIDFGKSLLGINSPSKVFMEIGQFTGEGLALGIESQAKAVQRATDRLMPTPSASSLSAIAPAGGSGTGYAFPDHVTLLDADGSILATTRVVAKGEIREDHRRRNFDARRGVKVGV